MGIEHLQEFIEKECSQACQPVDLLKISRNFTQEQFKKRNVHGPRGRNIGPTRLHLVVDAESCLDRLYGGYYSDWACGGQWNRMVHFLNNMMQACHAANMELVFYFNGAFEGDRLEQWYTEQMDVKSKVSQVIKKTVPIMQPQYNSRLATTRVPAKFVNLPCPWHLLFKFNDLLY